MARENGDKDLGRTARLSIRDVTTGQLLSLDDAMAALTAVFQGEEAPGRYAFELTGEDPELCA